MAGIGLAAFRFSVRHLDGDPRRGRFLGWLAFTVTAAYGLMLATHLLLLAAAWSLTSVGLHHLLTHYADRPEAVRAARKKFLISRLGDVALAGAAAVVWRGWGTFDLHALPAGAAHANPAECGSGDLGLSFRVRGAAAGSLYGVLRYRNVSHHTCWTGGYGGLSFVGRHGNQVGAAATRAAFAPWRVLNRAVTFGSSAIPMKGRGEVDAAGRPMREASSAVSTAGLEPYPFLSLTKRACETNSSWVAGS